MIDKNDLMVTSLSNDIEQERRNLEREQQKYLINSVQRRSYTPRKLVNRQKNFPFRENSKVEELVATAGVPGDSVFTQDATADDYYRLATKYPIIARTMDGPPDESVYPDVDPKKTPFSEYGANYGYNPRGYFETKTKLKNLINPAQMSNIPETTQRYYHYNFSSQWQDDPLLHRFPLRIPEDNLQPIGRDTRSAMHTEYMQTIGRYESKKCKN